MRPLVDLHILRTHSPDAWYQEALDSVADEPVRLHILDGIQGHVGRARADGLSRGDAPYVAWIDDDDRIVPGAVAAALDVLESDPLLSGTYSDMAWIDAGGALLEEVRKPPWCPHRQRMYLLEVHHFHVYRRSRIAPALPILDDWPYNEEWVLAVLSLRRYLRRAELLRRPAYRLHRVPGVWYEARRHREYYRSGEGISHAYRRRGCVEYGRLLTDLHRRGIRQKDGT